MKIIGQMTLSKTRGRTEPWITKKLNEDYFLSLRIIKIDEHEVTTTQDAFLKLKTSFPKIHAEKNQLNDLFVKASLPPGVEDICHITLGNFPDFRYDRSVNNDIDPDKVSAALSLDKEIVEFEINSCDFELVATCNIDKITLSEGSATKAGTVGFNRDAILNIKPSIEMQKKLNFYSQKIFGNDYVLWNSERKPVPYHMTIAQTNQLSNTLLRLERLDENQKEEMTYKY